MFPNRPDLYFSMGWLYWEKYKEPCKAQEYYRKALNARSSLPPWRSASKPSNVMKPRAMEEMRRRHGSLSVLETVVVRRPQQGIRALERG